jgi:GDP-L-fucose synthase
MSKLKLLLTGGGGLVGRNLLDHPSLAEFDVLAPRSSELDLRHFGDVKSYLSENEIDLVVHAAGKVGGIQANVREPVSFLVDNIDLGRNIVLASRQAGIKQLINLGSSCMYPRGYSEPLREEMVLKGELEPTNEGYALAKILTAKLCEYIMREDRSYQYKTLIPCNIYGRYDSFDPAHSHLVPAIIHKINQAKLGGHQKVDIWGDGKARREFMYAGDLADAIVRALDTFDSLPDIMNLGLGYDCTITEYYKVVAEVMGHDCEFAYDLSKPVGMARKLVSIERQQSWGWAATHRLREGIEKTVAFYLKEYQS